MKRRRIHLRICRNYSLNFRYSRFAANWKRRMNTSSMAMSTAGLKVCCPGIRGLDEVVAVREGRQVGQDLCHGRDLLERDEDAGDEDEREPDYVEHRHDVARALGRVRGKEGPHRRKAERGQENPDDERGDGEDRGPEDEHPGDERDGCDPDAVQEPAQALAEDYRVQGDGGRDEPVEGLHPPLDRDRDRLDGRCREEDRDRDEPGDHDRGCPGPPDRKRKEHEEGEEHSRDDDVRLEIVDDHVLLCDRPCRDELDTELPEPFSLISQRSSLPCAGNFPDD